jgi:hypothetical protein
MNRNDNNIFENDDGTFFKITAKFMKRTLFMKRTTLVFIFFIFSVFGYKSIFLRVRIKFL